MIIRMNKEDIKNLNVFLSRVQMSGQEAPVYCKLLEKINNAEEEIENDR